MTKERVVFIECVTLAKIVLTPDRRNGERGRVKFDQGGGAAHRRAAA